MNYNVQNNILLLLLLVRRNGELMRLVDEFP